MFKKRWLALALPLVLGFALDNGLPYALIDHANRQVEARSTLWNEAKVETLEFQNSAGTKLSGWWVPKSDAKQTVILLHTLGGNRSDLLDFAEPIWKAGFNLVMLDLRSHGMSDGKYFTYGFDEWKDVTAAIDTVNAKQPNQTFAVLGVSAGGTVAISAAARDGRIRKVVTIGTFADLGETIDAQTKWLPEFWRGRAIGGISKFQSRRDFGQAVDFAGEGACDDCSWNTGFLYSLVEWGAIICSSAGTEDIF
jgi:uncharacterized protein